jgi:hypothetical protein
MSNWDTCLFRNSIERETHITVINVTYLHKKMQQADDAFVLIAPTISARSTHPYQRLLIVMLVSLIFECTRHNAGTTFTSYQRL